MNILNLVAHSAHVAEHSGPSTIGYIICAGCAALLLALFIAAVIYNKKVAKRRAEQSELQPEE